MENTTFVRAWYTYTMRHKYRYARYHGTLTHPVARIHKFLTPLLLPLAIVIILAWVLGTPFFLWPYTLALVPTVLSATGATILRIAIAYFVSIVIAVPLALAITKNPKIEKIFLPIVDILESIPVLAFFPIIILFFIKSNFLEGAALFVLVITMLWSILFALIGGLSLVPEDIKSVTKIFRIEGLFKLENVTLPAMFPEMVTGSILAVANGWNIIIVAEVLHTYVSGGTQSLDLFGLGSLLVASSEQGNTALFLLCLLAMIIVIALVNVFLWQRLLRLSERYRFD